MQAEPPFVNGDPRAARFVATRAPAAADRNASVRCECLSQHYFSSLAEAQVVLAMYREDFNKQRPHSSLAQKTPAEFYAGTKTNVDTIEAPKPVA